MHRALLPFFAAAVVAQEPTPRAADDILRDYDAVSMPSMSDGSDPESLRRFKEAIETGCRRQALLALELHRGHPDHARVPELLEIRWAVMANALGDADAVVAETKALLARDGLRADLRLPAMHARAHALLASPGAGNVARLKAVRELIAADAANERTGHCLLAFVARHLADPETMAPLLDILVLRWADSVHVVRPAKQWQQLLARVGEPFAGLLPADRRAAFAAATKDAAPFTIVQLWSGWVFDDGSDTPDPELAALAALRQELGTTVRVVGMIDGDVDERLPAVKKAGADWPQLPAAGPDPMKSPLGVPQQPCYFVLDAEGRLAAVAGRAAAAAAFVRERAKK